MRTTRQWRDHLLRPGGRVTTTTRDLAKDCNDLEDQFAAALALLRRAEPYTDECTGMGESISRDIGACLAKHKGLIK